MRYRALLCVLLVFDSAQAQPADAGGPVIVTPTARCSTIPQYPRSERTSGVKGTVKIHITLDAAAKPETFTVAQSLGEAFDREALSFARECGFTGATVDGKPVPSMLELSVEMVPPVLPWVLTGTVVGELGQALEGATVSLPPLTALTDTKGNFTLTFDSVPPGDGWVVVEHAGHSQASFPEVFRSGQTTRARYVLKREKVYETRVEGSRLLPRVPDADRTPQVSHYTVTAADIDRTPGALEDVARVVQGLPGVAADPDLLANFFVRGGGPDEVLFLIDGVPLANPYHLGGFASIINPMMIDGADFYAGASPARYEPSLSGVLDVKYAASDPKKLKGVADVSMATAKARADIPLGVEGLSAVISFRRSYFEAYFAILKAFKLFGADTVAPDITEGLARVTYRNGRNRTMLTFIHASDGLNFVIKPGEEVLVNFNGGLKLSNTAEIVSLAHRIDLGGDSEINFVAAYTRDRNVVDVSSARRFSNDALRNEVLSRMDVRWVHSEKHRTGFGTQFAWRELGLTGEVTDTRAVAPWAQEPMVDNQRAYLPIAPRVKHHILSAYLEHTYQPAQALMLEGGARAEYDASYAKWLGSARLATAVTLPTQTVLKLSGGLVLQAVQRPLLLDETYGNPALLPERSVQLIAAVEQPLPFEALLRLEAWHKWLGNLAVNPDTQAGVDALVAAGQPVYQSLGSGVARGVDAMMIGRTRRVMYTLGAGLLWSERQNPLAVDTRPYPVMWEQRLTLSGSVSWSPNSKWLATARANFRSGRPYTPVTGFARDEVNARYVPLFGERSSATYPFFFELSLRGEYRFTWGPLPCAVYLELLNATNTMNVFSYNYSPGDFANGVEPQRGAFNHLPIRPFIGFRAEY
ncbi:MAG: TonB-dependent receptor [Myxococcaceae bacterium]|nr:TonB-dependent receptor [Myxococcaceae bacterium]